MDKWKGLVIVALLAGLGGYGYVSSRPETPPPAPTEETAPASATPSPAEVAAARFIGKPLPAWNFAAPLWVNTPKPITPADLKGHVTLVEFFRIGCSHCQEAAPFMQQISQTYGARGLKMVAIQAPGKGDPDENDWKTVKTRIKEWKWTHPVAFDEGGKTFREVYGLTIYPTVIVTDKNGIVRYFKTGHTPQRAEELIKFLDSALPKAK